MTVTADILVIGGGIAGISAAARLAPHARVVVLEAEQAFGYHSSGRSATFSHFGIGNDMVRGLTAYSRAFFDTPPDGFCDTHLSRPTPALFVARTDMVQALAALEGQMRRYTDTIERVDEASMRALVPALKFGGDGIVAGVVDHACRRLDSDALQQSYARTVRRHGGETIGSARVASIARKQNAWVVATEAGARYAAPVLVNAAGAWADEVAATAGVRPLGLMPKRRTIISFDPPEGLDVADWPFTKTAVDDFYMLPESGRLLASPVDEVDSHPVDAQPEDYDLALAAWKVEEYTNLNVPRIGHSWAGLRTFTRDRTPTAGFAPDAEGFFWLAGQGGYGLQTAPAMSDAVQALITGSAWPEELATLGVTPDRIGPARLLDGRA
jgi:D-arginine dehydrogenase